MRRVLVETFTNHDESRSVQDTLWRWGTRPSPPSPDVTELRLAMPNKHHLLVDLAPYGLDNPGEIFVATDRPYGLIEGTVAPGRRCARARGLVASVDFLQPTSWAEALELRAARPDAVAVQGGTDVMVDLNFDRRRPAALLDLGRLAELRTWERSDGHVRLGAGVSYTRVVDELAGLLPGLAIASRTVGSPQIRNRGTVGGNLGSASPAGDAHPPLLAAGAEVETASVRGQRLVPAQRVLRRSQAPRPRPGRADRGRARFRRRGPEQFAKVGPRNAMVIAVCSFALVLDPVRGRIGTGIGSAGPTPLRASEADVAGGGAGRRRPLEDTGALPDELVAGFGERVAQAARPIDDVRGSASYRTHALAVLARRTLGWAWAEYRGTQGGERCASS